MGDIIQLRASNQIRAAVPQGAFLFGNVRFYYNTKPSRFRIFLIEWLLEWEWQDMDNALYQQYIRSK